MIPRRCSKCQLLVDESESMAKDPTRNPLWAVPAYHAPETDQVPVAPQGTALTTGEPGGGGTRQGVVPAT